MRERLKDSNLRLKTLYVSKNISGARICIQSKKTSTTNSKPPSQTYVNTSNQSQYESNTRDTSTTKHKSTPISKDRNKLLKRKNTNCKSSSGAMIARSILSILRLLLGCVNRKRVRLVDLNRLIKKLNRNCKWCNRKFMTLIEDSNKYAGIIYY